MPKLISCGGRGAVFDDFMIAQANASDGEYIAMLIDSEEPLANIDQTWAHLIKRDGWKQAPRADDDQVLLMTTCMETWIVADRQALRDHYGPTLQEANLPDQNNLESRARDAIYNAPGSGDQKLQEPLRQRQAIVRDFGQTQPGRATPTVAEFCAV